MNLVALLDMLVEGMPGRVLVGDRGAGLTPVDLQRRAQRGAALVQQSRAATVVYLGGNGPAFPVALFSAARAGVPFLPINYRLSSEQLNAILDRQERPLILTDSPNRVGDRPASSFEELMRATADVDDTASDLAEVDPDGIAVLLMTSGTTAEPKSAVLRHRHLASYVFGTVEFMSADIADATIVSVPPYHIAAVANLLSNLYAGRRIVYLDHFTPAAWLDAVEAEGVTHAMVVPTMLVRLVDELTRTGRPAPRSLRSISYGGAKISASVLVAALRLFSDTGFVNAYGLTETASSIAVLGPDDHRAASVSPDLAVRARLSSVGRALPSVEIEIHDDRGGVCPPHVVGNIVVRGPQVAGEYLEAGAGIGAEGWFVTRDIGYLDDGGFLFVLGRSDDTIIRGGENIAPSEIEAVLDDHEHVRDCAVAGVPDEEWGQRIVAFVVTKGGAPQDAPVLQAYVRERLRGSKTPDQIVFLPALPTTATGKVLRRDLVELAAVGADATGTQPY